MEKTLSHRVSVPVFCISSLSVCLAGICFFDSYTLPFLCEVHCATAHFDEKRNSGISKSNK